KIASDCSMYLFIVGEHVENYHCRYCWHNAAIKYLSLMERSEVIVSRWYRQLQDA
ncbi:hypothetical protein HN51_031204, partial [Arachis hypogaea]